MTLNLSTNSEDGGKSCRKENDITEEERIVGLRRPIDESLMGLFGRCRKTDPVWRRGGPGYALRERG